MPHTANRVGSRNSDKRYHYTAESLNSGLSKLMSAEHNEIADSSGLATAERPPPFDLTSIDFRKYVSPCPTVFGNEGYSAKWLQQKVVNGSKLLMFPLEELNNLYFDDFKLKVLSSHRPNPAETFSLDNRSFYV